MGGFCRRKSILYPPHIHTPCERARMSPCYRAPLVLDMRRGSAAQLGHESDRFLTGLVFIVTVFCLVLFFSRRAWCWVFLYARRFCLYSFGSRLVSPSGVRGGFGSSLFGQRLGFVSSLLGFAFGVATSCVCAAVSFLLLSVRVWYWVLFFKCTMF